jgi:hypothetical protein
VFAGARKINRRVCDSGGSDHNRVIARSQLVLLRLSSRRFHDASTSEISSQILCKQKPLKTERFQ